MRHLKRKRNLGMSASHRRSLLSNLALSILDKERIVTTVAKAKEVRGLVERLITYGKRGGVHPMRLAAKFIRDKSILHKLFTEIAPSFKERVGGYTRIIKLGERKGDNALTAIIELTGRDGREIARQRKKKRKQPGTVAAPKKETPEKKGEPAKAPKPKKEKAAKKKDVAEQRAEPTAGEKAEGVEPQEQEMQKEHKAAAKKKKPPKE
jgi:large subunit ribosomal protein L17